MKKVFIPILPILVCLQIAAQQQIIKTNEIVFQLTSPSLSNDSSVYVCGNLPQLANWNPSSLKMKNNGNHTWSFTVKTEVSYPIEYKYTLGSWQREGAEANGRPLTNFIIKVRSDTIIKNNVLFWLNGDTRKISGKITGTVKHHTGLKGKGIPDRDIIVWLPPDYGKNNRKHYSVLYMQDGQNIFDPATSSFGVDWRIDETCDSMIKNKIIKPIIVVGIYNTRIRMSEYTPGAEGNAYMDFVVNVVKPFIDNNYRTLQGRNNTFIGGSSAGGTISFMLAWNFSEIFSKAICMSPAFKIQNIDVVKEVSENSGKKKELLFYFDNGGKGLEERLQPGIDEMIKILKERGFTKGQDLFWLKDPEAEHNEAAWAKRMPEALKLILKGKN